jgi:hypothetical protein
MAECIDARGADGNSVLLRRWSLRSRRNWIISSAVDWAAPMSLLFGGVFCAQGGLGFAAVY